ncbi:MAG: hypothetical protein LH478_12625 [Chitinophagaceae bacterium]|nr:hypothetical protein [Chitinophagaceae bacterium]
MNSTSSVLDELAKQSPLNLLHKIIRIFDQNAPRFQDLGRKTIAKLADKADLNVPDTDVTQLLDAVSEKATNAIAGFFGDNKENAIIQGAALGLCVGVGTVLLQPKEDYFSTEHNGVAKKKLLTVGMYIAGGILASIIVKQLEKNNATNGFQEH